MKNPLISTIHRPVHQQRTTFLLSALLLTALSGPAHAAWVSTGSDGRLQYGTDTHGNRIADFSYAGYHGGGVRLPEPASTVDVRPAADGESCDAIQNAIDQIARQQPSNGIRGVVRLLPGTYTCSRPIQIQTDGVVLRGSGVDSTTLSMAGDPHTAIDVRPASAIKAKRSKGVPVTDAYLPVGALSLHVAEASGFKVGDRVKLYHVISADWIHAMGMDELVRNGQPQTWIKPGTLFGMERTIAGIQANEITLDAPITDALDTAMTGDGGITLQSSDDSATLANIGIENLRITSPAQTGKNISEALFAGIQASQVRDVWFRNLELDDTVAALSLNESDRVTVQQVSVKEDYLLGKAAGGAAILSVQGASSQILFDRCRIDANGMFFFATASGVPGPLVILNSVFQGNGSIQPHMRWSTGLLVDSTSVPAGGIEFINRNTMGSGHGWAVGWSTVWNSSASSLDIEQPPLATSWCIGCKGPRHVKFHGQEGVYERYGQDALPASLYLEQLRERLGAQALRNIGY
ncbi:MAG: hypothetical protein JO142_07595 [Burkholderiales bacterium]|nr:hypothetical protein [Burkholderiales bacterium]